MQATPRSVLVRTACLLGGFAAVWLITIPLLRMGVLTNSWTWPNVLLGVVVGEGIIWLADRAERRYLRRQERSSQKP